MRSFPVDLKQNWCYLARLHQKSIATFLKEFFQQQLSHDGPNKMVLPGEFAFGEQPLRGQQPYQRGTIHAGTCKILLSLKISQNAAQLQLGCGQSIISSDFAIVASD